MQLSGQMQGRESPLIGRTRSNGDRPQREGRGGGGVRCRRTELSALPLLPTPPLRPHAGPAASTLTTGTGPTSEPVIHRHQTPLIFG